jgi:anti-anti-sigma factor
MEVDGSQLDIHVDGARTDAAVVRCCGSLTLATAGRLRHEVKALIQQSRIITIDLTGLTMMDSMGLGTIAALYASSRNAGRDLHVVNIGPRIREMFRVSRLLSLFEGPATVRTP